MIAIHLNTMSEHCIRKGQEEGGRGEKGTKVNLEMMIIHAELQICRVVDLPVYCRWYLNKPNLIKLFL
jgi:hypothetical protein